MLGFAAGLLQISSRVARRLLSRFARGRQKQRSTCGQVYTWTEREFIMKVEWLSAQFWKPPKRVKVHTVVFKVFKVADLQMATVPRFGDVPRQEIVGHGALWKRKIQKKDNFIGDKKQPYPHSELSVNEIILKNTAILTKFLKKVERNEIHVDLVLNCCELIQRKKTWGQHKRTALTQSFALPCSDIPSLLKRGLTSLPTMLVTKSYRVYEVVVVQLKRQGFVKVNHREPIK